MSEEKLVPLNVAWLSENGMLVEAGRLLGYDFEMSEGKPKADATGVFASRVSGGRVKTTSGTRKVVEEHSIEWTDDMMFTVAQLLELGFAPGNFDYCRDCGSRLTSFRNDQGGDA